MTGNLLNQGITLLIYGMGMVFTFLTLLVIGTTLMSKIVAKLFPEAEIEPVLQSGRTAAQTDAQLTAVIAAAIHQYRSRKKE